MLEVAAAAYANEGERQLHSDARNHFGSAARTQNPAQWRICLESSVDTQRGGIR
jgi:hypothetical protein